MKDAARGAGICVAWVITSTYEWKLHGIAFEPPDLTRACAYKRVICGDYENWDEFEKYPRAREALNREGLISTIHSIIHGRIAAIVRQPWWLNSARGGKFMFCDLHSLLGRCKKELEWKCRRLDDAIMLVYTHRLVPILYTEIWLIELGNTRPLYLQIATSEVSGYFWIIILHVENSCRLCPTFMRVLRDLFGQYFNNQFCIQHFYISLIMIFPKYYIGKKVRNFHPRVIILSVKLYQNFYLQIRSIKKKH